MDTDDQHERAPTSLSKALLSPREAKTGLLGDFVFRSGVQLLMNTVHASGERNNVGLGSTGLVEGVENEIVSTTETTVG